MPYDLSEHHLVSDGDDNEDDHELKSRDVHCDTPCDVNC